MKIAFVYPDIIHGGKSENSTGRFNFAIACLSAALKERGHQTSLAHFLKMPTRVEFAKEIHRHNPELLAFSYTEEDIDEVMQLLLFAGKDFDHLPNISGGAYPTLCPQEAINFEGANMICIGEGEGPLVELTERMQAGKPYDDIPSLWVRKADGVVKNNIMPMEEDLDNLPVMDFELFNFERLRTGKGHFSRLYFKASRGCPFNCSYCANHALKSNYPNKDKFVRFYSPERTIQMLEAILHANPKLQSVQFADDILPLRKEWFREFIEKYRRRIGLPFRCYVHLSLLSEETVRLLRSAGAYRVSCGIESANKRVREEIFNRRISNERMMKSLRLLKKGGLQIHGSCIIGTPTERPAEIWETLKFFAEAPIDIPIASILNPYEGTEIYNYAKDRGMLKDSRHILNRGTRLRLEYMSEAQLQFYYSILRLIVLSLRKIKQLPMSVRVPIEAILRFIFCKVPLPYRALNWIHDRWFYEFILTRIYRGLERGLFK